ncbi:PAQR family membrane homeostasis protein TrhA [Alteromonas sp. W364]|uniref:PAQR family membrane homeostasis protein TrhA n=1 Tax=Alteromonas sp. W364 TaxID=3075610 RepID=UPI00288534E7|nr:hemolysin III family protein [Alteromonas sp. W364]MDT0627279.1 hemolysin III family protein [Alteromonas sp. W364]
MSDIKNPPPIKLTHYSQLEEALNALSHFVGFAFAIVGTLLLLLKSNSVAELSASAIFGASMILLFGASTLYHWVSNEQIKPILKRADHIAIYLLIAGTYTPFLIVAIEGWVSTVSTITIWSVALLGVGFKAIFKDRFPRLAVTTYAVMGWLALLIIVPIFNALETAGFVFLVAGGVAYSLGIPFYMAKHKHYTHAIWHVFVLLGAVCHFYAIYAYVIGVK